MIWFANLDPSNLRLNLDLTQIAKGSSGKEIAIAISNCCFGNITEFNNSLLSIDGKEDKEKCVNLCSLIWHEQRHFLDLVLSNYGGYIFREYFTCYINIESVINELIELKEDLIFPLDVYNDEVRLKILNKSTNSTHIKIVAEDLQKRENAIMKDRLPIYDVEMGSYAILELIGFVFQLSAVENIAGIDYHLSFNEFINKNDPEGLKYKWVTNFSEILNYPISDINEMYQVEHIGMMPIIFYPALLTRSWKNDISDNKKGESFLSANSRISLILEYIIDNKEKFQSIVFEDIWAETNIMSKYLFGRTIVEEIEMDLFFQNQMLKNFSNINPLLKDIMSQYIDLKIDLLSILKSNPEQIFHPDKYVNKTLTKVRPIPIFYTPSAIDNNKLSLMGWESLHAIKEIKDEKIINIYNLTSIPKIWENQNILGFKELYSWKKIFLVYTAIAKLMIKGRNHKSIMGAELLTAEQIILESGVNIVYEPEFKYPTDLVMKASYLYDIQDVKDAICDMCGEKQEKPSGYIVSPWIFQKMNYYILIGGDTDEMRLKQAKDWSPWLICDSCYNELKNKKLI